MASDPKMVEFVSKVRAFPDATAAFTWKPADITDSLSTCVIVLDTNALLVPYKVGSKSLESIRRTYESLVHEKRLIVPGQVAREFAQNRAARLGELFKNLNDKKSQAKALEIGPYPLLEEETAYRRIRELEKEINKLLAEYRKAIGDTADLVQSWNWQDPVSALYATLFAKGVISDEPDITNEDVQKTLAGRLEQKLPPGYKDGGKDDGGFGDALIWLTILEVGKQRKLDLLFVSGDEKSDWWHQSDKQALYPRFELLDEYRRDSNGHTIHLISLSRFLELFGVIREVVEEVRKEEMDGEERVPHAGSALRLDSGKIMVVRHNGHYGAIQALRQRSNENGNSILEYEWWYQPNGTLDFERGIQNGVYKAIQRPGDVIALVTVGPIKLGWSRCSNSSGWLYFGPDPQGLDDYELAWTTLTDISKVSNTLLRFKHRMTF
jgi:hypothetical protein